MEKEIDSDIIKATQSSLGKYVKRPQLSEKLLRKPPFRFLHDIVTTVIKSTGFFDGLFDEEELISDNVKDRDSKIAFLNKVITVAASTTGRSLTVKPSKIVAGQEAEKTNELLQCIAFALDNKLSSDEAVKKYKSNSKPSTESNAEKPKETSKPVKKTSDTKKLTSRSSEKLTNNKKEPSEKSLTKNEKDRANVNKTKSKDILPKKESPPKKPAPTSKTLTKKNSVEKISNQTDKSVVSKRNSIIDSTKNEEAPKNEPVNDNADQDSGVSLEKSDLIDNNQKIELAPRFEEGENGKLNTSYTIADNDLNSSLSSQDLMEVDPNAEVNQRVNNEHGPDIENIKYDLPDREPNHKKAKSLEEDDHTALNNDSHSRPFSLTGDRRNSNHSEDKVRVNDHYESKVKDDDQYNKSITKPLSDDNTQNIFRPKSMRPSSSRPGAPRLREKRETVVAGTENLLVGKVNIIIENTTNEEEEDSSIVIVGHQASTESTSQDHQELQLSSNQHHGALVQQILDSQKEFSQTTGKTEIEWQFGAQKAREAINQEIEQLRFNIQALSRAANPLGKVLDHIQEDVEVMRQELQQWTKTYEEASKELLKQKIANEDSLLPLHTKLKQINADIEEKHDKINDLKIIIHKNSSRIEKLLASGDVQ